MTARRRPQADGRSLRLAEWDRMLRERSYLRPLPPPTPLHRMGQARLQDHNQDHNQPKERS